MSYLRTSIDIKLSCKALSMLDLYVIYQKITLFLVNDFFLEKKLQHVANSAARTLSLLDPQVLYTWGSVNSATMPLT